MMARFSQRQILTVGGAVAILVLLVAMGAMLARRGSVEPAFQKLLSADTMHAVSELSINLPPRLRGVDRPFTLITFKLDGDVVRHTDRTPEYTGALSLEARGRGNIFFADGQMRVLRDSVLFNLENLPVFLNPSGSLVKRWTEVETSLLRTENPETVLAALGSVATALQPDGTEELAGKKLRRYTLTMTEEEEGVLADVFRRSASANLGLDAVARLLDANRVKSFEVLIDAGQKEVRQVRVHFVRPFDDAQGQPQEFDFARLTMTFSDYGKEVAFDVPEYQLTTRPEVFARMFGTGQAEEVKTEEAQN